MQPDIPMIGSVFFSLAIISSAYVLGVVIRQFLTFHPWRSMFRTFLVLLICITVTILIEAALYVQSTIYLIIATAVFGSTSFLIGINPIELHRDVL